MKQSYEDKVLINLKRQYGKDELVASLMKKLSEREIEVGKLKSEVIHLEHELQFKREEKEVNRLARIAVRKEELYKLQKDRIKELKDRLKDAKKTKDKLINKLHIKNHE